MHALISSKNRPHLRLLHTPAELALLQLYRQLTESDQRIVHQVTKALVQCPAAK